MNQDLYKKLIYEGFFPNGKSAQPNFEISKKALEIYQNKSESDYDLVELRLYYVETGSEFINEFDGIDEDTCVDLEDAFEDALKQISENNLQNEFEKQCRKIVKEANDGYGFQDTLKSHFDFYFKK
jgi:hypothetical protein